MVTDKEDTKPVTTAQDVCLWELDIADERL